MHPIHITKEAQSESILSFIEAEMTKYQTKYIVLSFEESIRDIDRKKMVELIKKHFDIFVILKSELPKYQQIIEEYFSYGVHGLYFDSSLKIYAEESIEIMRFAVELFPGGWVFANTQNDGSMIEALLALKIVPVLQKEDRELVHFIKTHENFIKISRNFIKSVPLLDKSQNDYSLADKIRMKMLLETLNLRQKLMIKSIDESFNSSGL
ncbi:hypothetical protein [Cellulosilyticum sp. I15G10I2]|uniref:hypothetical protein n=1 Tax=Cellulosilyticum sp. I15G10I2 TaxID=1892843 RepID=UPI00085C8601|nr:hypothetical protein [Cellulosilyticum sp. I15G10I2]